MGSGKTAKSNRKSSTVATLISITFFFRTSMQQHFCSIGLAGDTGVGQQDSSFGVDVSAEITGASDDIGNPRKHLMEPADVITEKPSNMVAKPSFTVTDPNAFRNILISL